MQPGLRITDPEEVFQAEGTIDSGTLRQKMSTLCVWGMSAGRSSTKGCKWDGGQGEEEGRTDTEGLKSSAAKLSFA